MPLEPNGSQPELGVKSVHLDQLVLPPPPQPRRHFGETEMQQLVASVRECGIIQPLLVRSVGDKYEIVAGERRYRAALEVGLTSIPVIVRVLSDTEAKQYALTENLQRADLNPVEETEGILQLLELSLDMDRSKVISLLNQMANHKRGLTDNVVRNQEQVVEERFRMLGRLSSESFRTHRLPLLKLPLEVLEALRQGNIEYTKAKTIAKVKDEQFRGELLSEAIAQALSLSEIKERIRQHQAQQKPAAPSLKSQMQSAYAEVIKSKVWDDPEQQEELSALLAQMMAVISRKSRDK
ncbi:ParB/RepB/Spo0J family partition protein [[Phormidium] sp. ETS-05]|uniref:ParB/RepB/Spo0J family partition protein n=1 Tax=[Phormidium] sp. ETS-05 TaxID=222819 RepID=UPI0018EEE008|nr:ParB/RepB/Spo0J family partition protein [[Phormidium] sp. ETS-05]